MSIFNIFYRFILKKEEMQRKRVKRFVICMLHQNACAKNNLPNFVLVISTLKF